MVAIRIVNGKGIAPKVDRRNLQPDAAQTAQNIRLDSGNITPLREPLAVYTLPDSSRLSVFKYRGTWLSWATDVDVVRSQLADDKYERIYYTGDGVPKVRGLVDGVETVFDLGIPPPASKPKVTVQAKTATSWTRKWGYFYEETDGSRKTEGSLDEGNNAENVQQTTVGKVYTLTVVPARGAASTSAKFVLYFDAYTSTGVWIGRVYPDISAYKSQSELFINGAAVTGDQVNTSSGTTITKAVLTLTYETGSDTDYKVDRAYVYTYVSKWGEESGPSDPSDITTVDPSQDAMLTALASSPHPNVNKIRVYRTVNTDAGAVYKYVTEIDNGVASFLDTIIDAETAETMVSEDWDAPVAGLTGLCAMAGEFMAAFTGRTVYFSEQNYPHAWPAEYGYNVDYDIVAIKASGNTLAVMTKGHTYLMTGASPDAITTSKIPNEQSCSSKRSAVLHQGAIGYSCPDGYVVVLNNDENQTYGPVLTLPYFSKEKWAEWSPASMITMSHDGALVVFNGTTGLVITFGAGTAAITSHDIAAQGAWVDLETDTLYFIQGDKIMSWEGGATYRTAVWKSKEFPFNRPVTWVWGRVIADTYPVTYRLYANNVQVCERKVSSDLAFRLPALRPEKFWTIAVEGAAAVFELSAATSSEDFR